eukprot:GFKZ01009809.1.p2 GENE.GFKZ01009809.1~~GFKZ01009809.1.p2  ORF type:complete len:136 (+),score=15.16 GFKZ01009809.1:242-649(+)
MVPEVFVTRHMGVECWGWCMGGDLGSLVRLVQDEVCVIRVTLEINGNVRAGRYDFDLIAPDDVQGSLDEFGCDTLAAHRFGDIRAVDVVDGSVFDGDLSISEGGRFGNVREGESEAILFGLMDDIGGGDSHSRKL